MSYSIHGYSLLRLRSFPVAELCEDHTTEDISLRTLCKAYGVTRACAISYDGEVEYIGTVTPDAVTWKPIRIAP